MPRGPETVLKGPQIDQPIQAPGPLARQARRVKRKPTRSIASLTIGQRGSEDAHANPWTERFNT